ncbi:juvenile hormone epoxide hydrolase-like [Pieris napi]|uniref:juvenile hormone epoxide hydrolase-like n=1 Tax=Pieris napi TaxID=78633 RepID=UPI001FBB5502|nr:juvenile hormone epoxide hydrolase-like [Pieris napi]
MAKKKDSVKNEAKNVEKKGGFSKFLLFASIAVVIVSVGALQFYITLTSVPDLPKFDLDTCWGSNCTQNTDIRKFRIVFHEAMLENKRRKFDTYKRAPRVKSLKETSEYGINSDVLGQIFGNWQFKYKYPERARYFNQYEHYKTNIQGLDIHYMHVKPKRSNVKVIPLLLLHGWPTSIKEFYESVPLLTTAKPGYDFVFELIVPSLPGFGFSQGPVRRGLTTYQIAIVMRNLMERLGHKQFYVHGGNLGHNIGSHMATLFSNQVLGFHTTFPVNFSKIADWLWVIGSLWPSLVSNEFVDRMYPLSDKLAYYLEEFGYLHLQATKPDSIGIALQDSPVGLCAYINDRILSLTDPSNKLREDGGLVNYNTTDLVDNVMVYWSTGSITTSLRLYKEISANQDMEDVLAQIPTPVPTWALRPKHELYHSPDFVLRWKYPNLLGITNLDEGGHYLAFEKPVAFSDDIFKAVDSFLKFKNK